MPTLQVTPDEMLFLAILYQLESQNEGGDDLSFADVDEYMKPAAINPERLIDFHLVAPRSTVDGKPLPNTVSLTDAGRDALNTQLAACITRAQTEIKRQADERAKNPRRAQPEEFTLARQNIVDRLAKFAEWLKSGELVAEGSQPAPKKRGRPRRQTA